MSRFNAANAAIATLAASGMSLVDRIKTRLNEVTRGGVRAPGKGLLTLPWQFWDSAALGTTTAFQFFQSAGSTWGRQWPQGGQLAMTQGFALENICCWIDSGVDSTGAANAAGNQGQGVTAITTAVGPFDQAERLRVLHNMFTINMSVGARQIFNARSLYDTPRRCGPSVDAAAATNSATVINEALAFFNNGAPTNNFKPHFKPCFPIEPGDSVVVNAQTANGVTNPGLINSASGTINCVLQGYLIVEAQ